MIEESSGYLKKLRQCEIADLKQRYEVIRMQKGLPDFRRFNIIEGDISSDGIRDK